MHVHPSFVRYGEVKQSQQIELISESADGPQSSISSSAPETSDSPSYLAGREELCPQDKVDQQRQLQGYRRMRVAIVQTAIGLKATSGGFRSNYTTLLALSEHGHTAMQFCWAYQKEIDSVIADFKAKGNCRDRLTSGTTYMLNQDLQVVSITWWRFTDERDILCIALDADAMTATLPSNLQEEDAVIYIETGKAPPRARPYINWITSHLLEFGPTHVIFNDALTHILATRTSALKDDVARVGIIHSVEQLPTGPYAGGMSTGKRTLAELPLLKTLDGLVAVSKAVEVYAKQHCYLNTTMIPNHVWLYKNEETHDWPRYRQNFAKRNVVMVNPALVKGYGIFLDMAKENNRRSTDERFNRRVYNFIAYLSWGSTLDMADELKAEGVQILQPVRDVEKIFENTSVLIVPSLWYEAWGLVATEAQLRGIPVIASDVGGLREAKRFVGPWVSVNKICGTKRNADNSYIVPPQDVTPWVRELDRLLTDPDHYEAQSRMAYHTTQQWAKHFDVRGMEKYLLKLMK